MIRLFATLNERENMPINNRNRKGYMRTNSCFDIKSSSGSSTSTTTQNIHLTSSIINKNHGLNYHRYLLFVILFFAFCQFSHGLSCEQLNACSDKAGFEAISWIHKHLDEDASGTVDLSETDEVSNQADNYLILMSIINLCLL